MKKHLLSIFIFFAIAGSAGAQSFGYAFSQLTDPYVPLTGGTSVYGTFPWNSQSLVSVPIGFTFPVFGQQHTSLDMIPGAAAFPPAVDSFGFYTFFALLGDTGTNVSGSPVTYTVTGAPGYRILKIEVKDAGFENEMSIDGAFSSTVSFQSWFYELDGTMEVHMGPSNILDPTHCYLDPSNPGPACGPVEFNSAQTALNYALILTGNCNSPTTTSTWNLSSYPPGMTGTPTSGTVYRFSPTVSGVNEVEQVIGNIGLFPNPSSENATLTFNTVKNGDVQITITDMQGRVVSDEMRSDLNAGAQIYNINTTSLSNGVYVVSLISGNQKLQQRLVVSH